MAEGRRVTFQQWIVIERGRLGNSFFPFLNKALELATSTWVTESRLEGIKEILFFVKEDMTMVSRDREKRKKYGEVEEL